jgi:hypothetical protein
MDRLWWIHGARAKGLMATASVWDGHGGRSCKSDVVDGNVSTISNAQGGMGVYGRDVRVQGVICGVGAWPKASRGLGLRAMPGPPPFGA